MKRDLDYLRRILFDIEQSKQTRLNFQQLLSLTRKEEKYHYHIQLLCDVGYLANNNEGVYRMTNQGHDYLDAIRDDTIWSKTKKKLEPAGSVSLEIVKQVATGFVVDLIT